MATTPRHASAACLPYGDWTFISTTAVRSWNNCTDGSTHSYRVSSTVDYNLAAIDMGAILHGREGRESITLMTCSGPPNADGYPERTVVLAERVD